MSFEEVWARCCFCFGALFWLMQMTLIAYGIQVYKIRLSWNR